MSTPRLEINLKKIQHNASTLVKRLAVRGIAITGVTKASLGCPEIAGVLLRSGVSGLGDSRIENIEAMRNAGVVGSMTLIRSPMLSQVERLVAHTDLSLNTELDIISALSSAAQKAKLIHSVVLMVELGDLREGIMPKNLLNTVRKTLGFPNILFKGIGTNLACRCGVSPDIKNMAELSALADSIDSTFGPIVSIVSGGNSANIDWALSGADIGRINNLRLGEALLLGCEPLQRQPIKGLFTNAFSFIAEVIESKHKPSQPWGRLGQNALGVTSAVANRGDIFQTVLATGQQDVDSSGLQSPTGIEILGASSDHLIVESEFCLPLGTEISFQLNYSALVRAMTSPFVTKTLIPTEHSILEVKPSPSFAPPLVTH